MDENAFRKRIDTSGWAVWTTKVVGVTFENEDGIERQKIIRKLAKKYDSDLEIIPLDIGRYEHEGKPAYLIISEFGDIGNLSQEAANEIAQKEKEGYFIDLTDAVIYGGPDEDMPSRKYGVKVEFMLASPEMQKSLRHTMKNQTPATVHIVNDSATSEPVHVIIEEKASSRKKNTALLLCFALGIFGGHRFYCGKIGTAIVNLIYGLVWFRAIVLESGFIDMRSPLTSAFAGILPLIWLIDVIRIVTGNYRDRDGKKLEE